MASLAYFAGVKRPRAEFLRWIGDATSIPLHDAAARLQTLMSGAADCSTSADMVNAKMPLSHKTGSDYASQHEGSIMDIREQRQQNPVAAEVLALTAVVRPILTGTLYALKKEVLAQAGGYDNVKLLMLSRLYKAGDGDCGICFEYAVHDAISRHDARVIERIEDAAKLCKLTGQAPPKSLLFGLEKTGTQQLTPIIRESRRLAM